MLTLANKIILVHIHDGLFYCIQQYMRLDPNAYAQVLTAVATAVASVGLGVSWLVRFKVRFVGAVGGAVLLLMVWAMCAYGEEQKGLNKKWAW
jgi:hypothetical protein